MLTCVPGAGPEGAKHTSPGRALREALGYPRNLHEALKGRRALPKIWTGLHISASEAGR